LPSTPQQFNISTLQVITLTYPLRCDLYEDVIKKNSKKSLIGIKKNMYLCRPKRGKPNEFEAGSWSEKEGG
jgi:hypothetical protein